MQAAVWSSHCVRRSTRSRPASVTREKRSSYVTIGPTFG